MSKLPKHPKGIPPHAELHAHAGSSVDSAVLWSIAHEQGIKLTTKDYWAFTRAVTVFGHDEPLKGMKELDKMFHMTELIQSSPLAMNPLIKDIIGGGYRSNNIVLQELRFNPMKRNRGGERDLDHMILAAIRGMERALLEYPYVQAGLILMMDRTFSKRQNEVILEKAIKYHDRGIIGIDVAGPQSRKFKMKDHTELFLKAKDAGLGVTIHTGEEGGIKEMKYVVDEIKPDRIGHGVLSYTDPELIEKVASAGITLELCPSSNLNIGVLKDITELKKVIRTLYDAGIKLTINTDGPEMHGTNLSKEFALLKENDILNDEEISQVRQNAFDATFIK